MSNLVIYRKYRPQKFEDVIGQEHIVKTLKNQISSGRIAHAYLFSGPRGTGKTTIARLFAKSVNCHSPKEAESCGKCHICLEFGDNRLMDIIEIDAASQTGVDNVRELIDAVRFSPTMSKHKVYIIDEVHMFSKSAFNALLKTLEEPPAHAIFILATTELEKVPPTIVSRSQHFDFRKLKNDHLIHKLKIIAKNEGIKVEDDALRLVAKSADGSLRDAESLFEQLLILKDKEILKKDIEEILGLVDSVFVSEFVGHLADKNIKSAILLINRLADEGRNLESFAKMATHYLRSVFLLKLDPEFEKSLFNSLNLDEINLIKSQADKMELNSIESALKIFAQATMDSKRYPLPQMALEVAAFELLAEE